MPDLLCLYYVERSFLDALHPSAVAPLKHRPQTNNNPPTEISGHQHPDEISLTNIRFRIPQVARQPSYNLGVAVTLTLHEIAFRDAPAPDARRDLTLTHREQAEAGRRFRAMLDSLGFMRDTNRAFITENVQDIFFRMALRAKDRDVILAMFRKALEGPRITAPRKAHDKETK